MKILLDTHMLIWILNGDERVSDRVKYLIMDEHNQIYYSAASIWEVAIKHSKRPDKVPFSAKELEHYCIKAQFLALSISSRHVTEIENLKIKAEESVNGDPFDRLLITQAKVEGMMFITHDSVMTHYDEQCILVN